MKKKANAKKSTPTPKRRIPRQDALPGMGDAKIAAIETAALDYVEIRDERQALTAQEVSLKGELIALMHKAEKMEYKRGGLSVKLVMEKENVKVRVKDEGDVSVEVEEEGPEAA